MRLVLAALAKRAAADAYDAGQNRGDACKDCRDACLAFSMATVKTSCGLMLLMLAAPAEVIKTSCS